MSSCMWYAKAKDRYVIRSSCVDEKLLLWHSSFGSLLPTHSSLGTHRLVFPLSYLSKEGNNGRPFSFSNPTPSLVADPLPASRQLEE